MEGLLVNHLSLNIETLFLQYNQGALTVLNYLS